MIVCPNCNKELSEDSKFCDACGAKINETVFCQHCGKQISADSVFCEGCGGRVGGGAPETPVAPIAPEAPMADFVEPAPVAPAIPKAAKKLPKKAILFGGIGIAVVAVIIIVIVLINALKKPNTDYLMYVKDSEFFATDLNSGSAAWQVSSQLMSEYQTIYPSYGSNFKYFVQLSKDGSTLFYPDRFDFDDESFGIYYRKIDSSPETAKKIASDVHYYYVNASATVVTYLDEDENLYRYTLGDENKEKIASNVENFMISDDGEAVLFFTEERSIYIKQGNAEKEKLASEVSEVCHIASDLTTVYYLKDNALYKQTVGEEKIKLDSDIETFVSLYETGEAYYIKRNETQVPLVDYIIDDMKDADAAMTEPEAPEYPYSWNYDTYDEYLAARDQYDKDYDAYEEAREAYWAKEDRDELREDISDRTINLETYTLYYFNGEESVVVCENFDKDNYYSKCEAAVDEAVIIYRAYSPSEVSKVKLSEIESYYTLEDSIRRSIYDSPACYVAVKDKATDIKRENLSNPIITPDGGDIYFLFGEETGADVYHISINDGAVSEPTVYENDVYDGLIRLTSDNKLLYFKEYDGRKGDLYIDKTRIDYDVEAIRVYESEEHDAILYYVDWSSERGYGTLKLYKDGESTKIADDVCLAEFTYDGKIAYLNDYSRTSYKGALHVWEDGASRKIADDVSCFFSF